MFDQMFSYSRLYNSAGSNACSPVLIHSILFSGTHARMYTKYFLSIIVGFRQL